MDSEKIQQELENRFAAPLPEFYKRRIIVWHDEDSEFADVAAQMKLSNAKIAILGENNNFAIEKLLRYDDTLSNYLLYCPAQYSDLADNRMLDMEYYAEQFSADKISMCMNEMGIAQTPGLRNTVKQPRKFFSSKARRKLIAAQRELPASSPQLLLAVMCAISGAREPKPASIIKAVLSEGLENDANTVYQDFAVYGIDTFFRCMASQGTGYKGEPELGCMAVHILLTAATRTIGRSEFFAGLESCVSASHQPFCYDMVSDWLHCDDKQKLREIAEYVKEKALLHQRFMKLDAETLSDCEIFPCADVALLLKMMKEIANRTANVQSVSRTVEKHRTAPWYGDVKWFYDAI